MKFLTRSTMLFKALQNFRLILAENSRKMNSNPSMDDDHILIGRKSRNILLIATENPSIINTLSQFKPTNESWKSIRNLLLEKQFKEHTVDNAVIEACFYAIKDDETRFDVLKSYYKFMRNNNIAINIAVANKMIKFLSWNTSKEDEQEILWMYDNIFKNMPHLQPEVESNIILGLCATGRWREVESIASSNPTKIGKAIWVATCFKNNEYDLGWEYLNKFKHNMGHISQPIMRSYTEYLERNSDDVLGIQRGLIKLLRFLRDWDMKISKSGVQVLVDYCSSINWHGSFVNISDKGICPNCNVKLTKSYLTLQEYSTLTQYILDKVLIAKDVYRGSNPQEMMKFVTFINETAPYDVVIDGLNVYYKHMKSKPLPIVIQQFKNKYDLKNILVLARAHLRQHMKSNPICNKVSVYYIDNLSNDDSFMLYAALKSGPKTTFISNDLMRSEKWKLQDEKIKKLFKIWQNNHQKLVQVSGKSERISLISPINYPDVLNNDIHGWHIPYHASDNVLPDSYDMIKDWVCLRYNTISKK